MRRFRRLLNSCHCSRSCSCCGCRSTRNRALYRARLLVTVVQGSWIIIQVLELMAR